jgi:ligand-binding sensor domain-containing protein/serine phosphatase RsbU (regulator of sigma subunit)
MNISKSVIRVVFVLAIFWSNISFAQAEFTSETISVKDGLSSNGIRTIIQDMYGYIWIATNDGVNVYDGYNINIYKNIPDDSTSLPSNSVYRILEDREGTIWISTDEGLAEYNRTENKFATHRFSESTAELSNQATHIYEDKKNNLWVSTPDGILLFDRETREFKRFDVMSTDNSVSRFVNYGGSLIESSSGVFYCTAQSFGLLKFDYNASLFVQVSLTDAQHSKIINNIYYDIVADSQNNLWIGLSSGLLKVDLNQVTLEDVTPYKKVAAQNAFVDNATAGLLIDGNEGMWVGTGRNGMYYFNFQEQKFKQLLPPSATSFYNSFYKDKSGILWFGSSRGVTKYDFDRKPFVTYSLTEESFETNRKEIYAISKSTFYKNKVWLSTAMGLYLFDNKSNKTTKASLINNRLSYFDEIGIFTVLEMNDGVLWLATLRDGLYAYNLNSGKIKNYKHSAYDNTTITNNSVHNLAVDKDENLWVATHEGLNFLKKGSDKFIPVPSFFNRPYDDRLINQLKRLRENVNPTSSIIRVGDYADISKEFVLRNDSKIIIYSVGEGLFQWDMVDFGWLESEMGDTLWTGGVFKKSFHAGGGLKNRIKIGLLDLKAGRYKLRYLSDDSHSVESYNTIPPQDSIYWGTQLFTLNDNEFKTAQSILKESDERTFLKGEDTKVIFCDSKNNVWIGSDDGISFIDSNSVIKNYFNNSANSKSLSNNLVRDIIEDLNGNIWIATADGLNKLTPGDSTFTVLREQNGLPSSNLSSIEIDNKGDLWVSSLKGISKIELNEKGELQIVVNYDVKDGLQGYEFIQSSSYKDESGKLYFGGVDGFNAFYPGSSNKTPPFISFQDIKVSNKSVKSLEQIETSDLNLLTNLSLSHNQNDLSFEFASIHFSRPDKNRMLYKMEGIDDDWQVGDRRFASYANMNPGNYTFYLKGSNGDGIWNENIKAINIKIAPPWYNNWIAYTFYVFLFFGLLFSVRKFEINRQQKNAQIQESRLRIETAEAKAEAAEAKALIVQAENNRKSKELEEARELQLSMLPKELPQLPNLDIAVYMKTATEVGGDYYDFHIGMDGTLTVVLGDATGHGMKAGTMVTTTKSLFNVLAPNPNIVDTFHEMTRCLKLMHLEKLSMCMSMLKITGSKVRMSAAGMPPIFIYKRESQSMEEHVMKGMPLGTFNNFPYTLIESDLSAGDTILLMSDGFPELFNDEKEMFGYKRVRNLFEEVSGESPEDIIAKLKSAGAEWVNDKDPDDDVTFVVIKVK